MKLFINEFIKDYKKRTTWIYILLTFVFIGVYGWILKTQVGSDYNPTTIMAGITQVPGFLALVFSLIMLANNLSQEYSKGTIKFLYTRPKSRSAILTAKIILGFVNYIVFLILGSVFNFLISYYVFFEQKIGINQLSRTLESGYFGRTVLNQLIITNLTDLAVMIFYISLVVILCVVFKTQILSLVLVMMSLLGGSIITQLTTLVIDKYSWIKYHLFDVSLFSSYYSSEMSRQLVKESFKFDNANPLLVMLVAYSAIFFIVSYIVNARRDITID